MTNNKEFNVYKITNDNFEKCIYIGSTSLKLAQRLSLHKSNKTTTACKICDGQEKIECLAIVFNKEDAEDLETHVMNIFKEKPQFTLLNKKGAGSIRRCGGVKEYKNERLKCCCGKTYTRSNFSNHKRTKYHKEHEAKQHEKITVSFN